MDNLGDLGDVRVKQTNGIWVGEHQTSSVFVSSFAQGLDVDASVGERWDADNVETSHRSGSWVGAVCRVRNQDVHTAFVSVFLMVFFNQHQTGQLAVRARRRLEGHVVHAGDLAQILSGKVERLQTALYSLLRLQRMDAGKAGKGGDLIVYFGVIFHGAGAERVEAVVDAVGLFGKLGVVAAQLVLAHLWQMRGLLAAQRGVDLAGGDVAGGQDGASSAGVAAFK